MKEIKMKIEITEAQLEAIKTITNDISAMVGCSEDDKCWKKCVRLIDNMLKKNNLKERDYK